MDWRLTNITPVINMWARKDPGKEQSCKTDFNYGKDVVDKQHYHCKANTMREKTTHTKEISIFELPKFIKTMTVRKNTKN